jgi:hypothetical protein
MLKMLETDMQCLVFEMPFHSRAQFLTNEGTFKYLHSSIDNCGENQVEQQQLPHEYHANQIKGMDTIAVVIVCEFKHISPVLKREHEERHGNGLAESFEPKISVSLNFSEKLHR